MTYRKKLPLPPLEFLHECFIYNKKTGLLTWKKRPKSHFDASWAMNVFNHVWPGKVAGSKRKYIYNTYISIGIHYNNTQKSYFAHRIIWLMNHGSIDAESDIDHIDHNGLNNRLSNLREVTPQENQLNQNMRKDNTSGFMGVTKSNHGERWIGRAGYKGKRHYVGTFDTPEKANIAVKAKQKELGFHENHGV